MIFNQTTSMNQKIYMKLGTMETNVNWNVLGLTWILSVNRLISNENFPGREIWFFIRNRMLVVDFWSINRQSKQSFTNYKVFDSNLRNGWMHSGSNPGHSNKKKKFKFIFYFFPILVTNFVFKHFKFGPPHPSYRFQINSIQTSSFGYNA